MLFSLNVLSDSGKASDPEISPLISARCAGDTAVRLMAHSGLEPVLPLRFQRVTDPALVTAIRNHRNTERPQLRAVTRLRDIHPPDRAGPPGPDGAVHPHRHVHPGRGGQRDLPVDPRRLAASVALRRPPHADQRVAPAPQHEFLQVPGPWPVTVPHRLEDPAAQSPYLLLMVTPVHTLP